MCIYHACVYISLHLSTKNVSPFPVFLLQSKLWNLQHLWSSQNICLPVFHNHLHKELNVRVGSTWIFWKPILCRCFTYLFKFDDYIHYVSGEIEVLSSKWLKLCPRHMGSKEPIFEIRLTSLLSWKVGSLGFLLSRTGIFKLQSGLC